MSVFVFQFLIVRLKYAVVYEKSDYIDVSIPYSTIKIFQSLRDIGCLSVSIPYSTIKIILALDEELPDAGFNSL